MGTGDTIFVPGNAEHGVRCLDEEGEGLRWFYCFAVGSFADVGYRFPGEEGYEAGRRKEMQAAIGVQKTFWRKVRDVLGFCT